jgi:GTPase SAR1 family protein
MSTVGRYGLLKRQVLDFCRECLDSLPMLSEFEDALQLKRSLDSLEQDRFRISVIGEVSAGKSCLVNALIGRDWLPCDVRQCTSAIVQVSHDDSTRLRIVFADGSEQRVSGEVESLDLLSAPGGLWGVAQIRDEFRAIPTGLIDTYVIAGQPIPSVVQLEEQSGFRLVDHKELIADYIENWALPSKIPVEIYLTVPFTDGIRPLTIVDTPGINAVGGIQGKTWNYLMESDTVIVTWPIKRAELTSLRDLVRKCVEDFSAERVYVVLTHSGLCSKTDRNRILEEARRLLDNVSPERIIAVDSVLRCLEREARTQGLSRILEDEQKAVALFHLAASELSDEAKFLDSVNRESNFDTLERHLAELGRRVPVILVERVLDYIAQLLCRVPEVGIKMELENHRSIIRERVESYKLFGEGLVWFGGKKGVFAVDKTCGELKWQYETEDTVTSEIVFLEDALIFGCYDGSLRAVQVSTKEDKWKVQTEEKNWFSLTAGEGVVCFGSRNKVFYALDARDGSVIWERSDYYSIFSEPTISDGIVYFGNERDGTVHALDLKTGNELWAFRKRDWRCPLPKLVYPRIEA